MGFKEVILRDYPDDGDVTKIMQRSGKTFMSNDDNSRYISIERGKNILFLKEDELQELLLKIKKYFGD